MTDNFAHVLSKTQKFGNPLHPDLETRYILKNTKHPNLENTKHPPCLMWIEKLLRDMYTIHSDPTSMITSIQSITPRGELRDYHVALDPNRHTQDNGMAEFKRMCDAQLVTDALLTKRYVRKLNIIIEMEMRQEARQEEEKMKWFQTQDLKEILLHKKEHHIELAMLMGSHPKFEKWVMQQYKELKLDAQSNADVLLAVMDVMRQIQSL